MTATAAQSRLSAEQQRNPPPAGCAGRVGALFSTLQPKLPAALLDLKAQGNLVAGEIGRIHPDVGTAYVEHGYSIEFTTGMMLYTELIARYCAGTFVEGASGSPALALDQVKQLMEAVMQTYKRQARAIWKKLAPKFSPQNVSVSEPAAQLREALLESMRLFMLAHELGHVALGCGACKAESDNDEVAADSAGLELALPAAAEKHHWRLAIAGAAVAIRLFVSLERFGVRFGTVYPPQEQRLALLETKTRALVGGDQRGDEYSTVMVALLDLMDDLDARITTGTAKWQYTESRARIGLLARLIEVAGGSVSVPAFIAMLQPYADDLSTETLGRVLNALCDYYYGWAETRGTFIAPDYLARETMFSHGELIALSQALRSIVDELPPAYALLLERRFAARA